MSEADIIDGIVQRLRDLKLTQPSLASSEQCRRPVRVDVSAPISLTADERDALLKKLAS